MDKKCTIAICDDEVRVLGVIANSVQAAFANKFEDVEVCAFSDTAKLEKFLEENPVDLLLLDISMPKCDGVQFATRLREKGYSLPISFVTSAEERVWESFRVNPFGFVRKSHFLSDLLELVERFSQTRLSEQTKAILIIEQKAKTYRFDMNTIEYIESCQRNQKLFFTNGEEPVLISGYTIAYLAEKLKPNGFYRVHKGYVINLSRVKLISAEGVYMKSGVCVPINKRNVSEFKTVFLEYSMDKNVNVKRKFSQRESE